MDEITKHLINSIKEMTKYIKSKKPVMPFDENVKNLTISQLDVIGYLYENKKARMTDLTKKAGVKMPTMTDIVDKLVKANIIERERDENDRRTVWVKISPKLQKHVNAIMRKHDEYIEKVLSVLSKKEKETAISIIDKIIKSLKEGVK